MSLWDSDTIGAYRIEGYIGLSDGFEEYRGRHRQASTDHVIRLMASEHEEAAKDVVRAANALRRLQHPNVMSVVDVVQEGSMVGLVVDFVDGPALSELLSAGPLHPADLDELARGILRGAAAAHKRGRVHGRLDADHVVLEAGGDSLTPRIVGYGFTVASSEDVRVDVFDLGVLFYTMVAGQPPFSGRGREGLAAAIEAGTYAAVDEVVPNMAERMSRTIGRALVVDREATYSDAYAMLHSWESEVPQPELAPPPKPASPAPAPAHVPAMPMAPEAEPRWFPWQLLLPIVGGLVVIAVAVGWLASRSEPEIVLTTAEIVDVPFRDFVVEENIRASGRDELREVSSWDAELYSTVSERIDALRKDGVLVSALERGRQDYAAELTRLTRERSPAIFATAAFVARGKLNSEEVIAAWRDPTLRASGAAVQIALAAHHAGYTVEADEAGEADEIDEIDEASEDEKVAADGQVLPAFKRWAAYRSPADHPSFIGENLTCPASLSRDRCDGVLYSDAQAFVPEVLATHALAVCYYAANHGSAPPFDAWKPYLGGYCAELGLGE